MRTTVTLDADAEAVVRRRMQERGVSFKQAVNGAILDGAAEPARGPGRRTTTADLGLPAVNLDRAIQLAADLEDDEVVRKMRSRK